MAAWADRVECDRPFPGQTDIDLDEIGRAQAWQSARRLAALEPDLLISSDLRRTRDTMAALAEITGKQIQPDERLRETFAANGRGSPAPKSHRAIPRSTRPGAPVTRC